eukprot:6659252-Pyramimonas_sp.AAC.1
MGESLQIAVTPAAAVALRNWTPTRLIRHTAFVVIVACERPGRIANQTVCKTTVNTGCLWNGGWYQ